MYTLAAWMYEAHFGQPPVLMPGAERVKVAHLAYHDDAYSDRVQGFLANCLTRDPAQRLTAAEASIHPCLTKSLVVRVCLCAPGWVLLLLLLWPSHRGRRRRPTSKRVVSYWRQSASARRCMSASRGCASRRHGFASL